MNKVCMSCTGNMETKMQLFKIACINYDSNPVFYQGTYNKRNELISLQKVIADMGKDAAEAILARNKCDRQLNVSISPERAEMTAQESGLATAWRTPSNIS